MNQTDLFETPARRKVPNPNPVHDVDGRFVSGEVLAERGKALALKHSGDWSERIVIEAGVWFAARKREGMQETTIEAFRQDALNEPVTHYAWGSLPRLLCKAGLIEQSLTSDGHPKFTKAGSLKTHAHPVRVWKIL